MGDSQFNGPPLDPSSFLCQNCLQKGHFTYHCTLKRKNASTPTPDDVPNKKRRNEEEPKNYSDNSEMAGSSHNLMSPNAAAGFATAESDSHSSSDSESDLGLFVCAMFVICYLASSSDSNANGQTQYAAHEENSVDSAACSIGDEASNQKDGLTDKSDDDNSCSSNGQAQNAVNFKNSAKSIGSIEGETSNQMDDPADDSNGENSHWSTSSSSLSFPTYSLGRPNQPNSSNSKANVQAQNAVNGENSAESISSIEDEIPNETDYQADCSNNENSCFSTFSSSSSFSSCSCNDSRCSCRYFNLSSSSSNEN
ncbi:hypothetical protein TNCT_179851 [Trichonephila clavata]|uniref:Uncharacterized protein n=1 Tax=Trichonephila clavata TaxID=2740835 RepID=A0A8X6GJ66_TRICU|nr:hypothetical protein TNCT_179851 [Trichonephila clavata]